MKFRTIATALVLALTPSIPFSPAHAESAKGSSAKVGEAAPPFTLTDSKGTKHSLTDYKGKYVVLEWFNADCPFVKKHYDTGNMQRMQEQFEKEGVVWLTVNSSAEGKQGHLTPELAEKIIKEKGLHSSILLDPDGKVGKAYEAKTTPHMYLIDPKGVLKYAGAIDDKPSTDKGDVPTAKNYLKEAFEQAKAGKEVTVASTEAYGCSIKYAG